MKSIVSEWYAEVQLAALILIIIVLLLTPRRAPTDSTALSVFGRFCFGWFLGTTLFGFGLDRHLGDEFANQGFKRWEKSLPKPVIDFGLMATGLFFLSMTMLMVWDWVLQATGKRIREKPPEDFQSQLRLQVAELLEEFGDTGEPELVSAQADSDYLKWTVPCGANTLEVFVYENEAGYHWNGQWKPFESQDYLHEPEKLQQDFLKSLRRTLETRN